MTSLPLYTIQKKSIPSPSGDSISQISQESPILKLPVLNGAEKAPPHGRKEKNCGIKVPIELLTGMHVIVNVLAL